MSSDRSWMWRHKERGSAGANYTEGVIGFLNFAFSHEECVQDNKIRCPCKECKNRSHMSRDDVQYHLYKFGFMRTYDRWVMHGEPLIDDPLGNESLGTVGEERSRMEAMVMDAAGPEFNWGAQSEEQQPNREAQKFYDLLNAADEPLYEGCKTHTKLSAMSQMFNLKSEFNMSELCYDRMAAMVKEMLPESDRLPQNLYKTKRELTKLGLEYEKIDSCPNNCMLYYKETKEMQECGVCHHARYKPDKPGSQKKIPYKVLHYLPLTPRLQRLYMSSHSAEHMTWHTKPCEDGTMAHPAHGEAWKHFDRTNKSFASEPRNVRIGLCTDGFSPFNNFGKPYSCWPVIITVYNLPPWMCMNKSYMFLNMVIPGPRSPGKNIDVFLRPLIDELKMLWSVGIQTYDVSRKENFIMRAALMWTISDFPAYAMLSGWSTHGKLACPYCMELTKSFYLKFGRKASWFDCHRQFLPLRHRLRKLDKHFKKGNKEKSKAPPRLSGEEIRRRVDKLPDITFGIRSGKQEIDGFNESHNWVKRSIFWELTYWHTNLIRHNLDVMHIEKNFFDNIFNTVMDVKGKTKDNAKARQDLELYCDRTDLHLVSDEKGRILKPKASYVLNKDQIRDVCTWVRKLKFPDGYVSNIAQCVSEEDCKFHGMKSHDCHVFMQRLLPIAFRDLLPKPVWEALTDVSHFFRDICSTVLRVRDVEQLEADIAEIICNLEKIFPPGFFDSMEHLPIHLAYEAKVGGPVQYRWMYPFERFLHHLKKKVGNRARVEASIVKSYLNEEISNFCSLYFKPNVQTRLNRVPRNDDGGQVDERERLSIFTHPGRALGPPICRKALTEDEINVAHRYVLLNCAELNPFIEEFDSHMMEMDPTMSPVELSRSRDAHFCRWLNEYVNRNEVDTKIRCIAYPPRRTVKCYKGYFVNGFKFHTVDYGKYKTTMNSGVCVLGSSSGDDEKDYYGMVEDIIELDFFGEYVTLFKCHWFDTSSQNGIRMHPKFKLVEVNQKSKLKSDDRFILAQQAHQVYYTGYPKRPQHKDRGDWVAVCKIKARSRTAVLLLDDAEEIESIVEGPFQEGVSSAPGNILSQTSFVDGEIHLDTDGDLEEVDPSELGRTDEVDENEADIEHEKEFDDILSEEEHEHIHESGENARSSGDDFMDYDD